MVRLPILSFSHVRISSEECWVICALMWSNAKSVVDHVTRRSRRRARYAEFPNEQWNLKCTKWPNSSAFIPVSPRSLTLASEVTDARVTVRSGRRRAPSVCLFVSQMCAAAPQHISSTVVIYKCHFLFPLISLSDSSQWDYNSLEKLFGIISDHKCTHNWPWVVKTAVTASGHGVVCVKQCCAEDCTPEVTVIKISGL